MKNPVMIKSFPNGITVFLDETLDYPILLQEIAVKFKESEHFFKKGKMAVSFDGRPLTEEQEREIADVIMDNSGLTIVCIVGKDEETNETYLKAIHQSSLKENEETGQFYRGCLQDGQTLETSNSIIVLGDVNPGASIISNKDIIIIGGLYGEAYAGGNGETGHFVAALEMMPQKLKIGDFKYRSQQKKSKWPWKHQNEPKIAYVKDHKVMMDNITKELLNDLPF